MKATGMIRVVDHLGRVVIPKEIRKVYGINKKDPIEIFTDNDCIIFKKYKNGQQCMVTGEISNQNLVLANGKIVLSLDAAKAVFQELQQHFGTVS